MNRGRGGFGYGSTVQEYHDNPVQPYRDEQDFARAGAVRGQSQIGSFAELVDSISSNIFVISNSATTLDRTLKQVGTNKDCVELRKKIHETEEKTNSIITETASQFKHLQAAINKTDRAQKLQMDRLMAEFKDVTQKYHSLQKKVADRAKLMTPPSSSARSSAASDLINWNEPEDDKSHLIDQKRKQMQLQAETAEVDVALLEERENQIQQLESDILNINDIFKELGTLVHEQGTVIDTIEANVESAGTDVELGAQQLERAAVYQSRARKKKCCLLVILLVVVVIIVVIIVVSVKAHK